MKYCLMDIIICPKCNGELSLSEKNKDDFYEKEIMEDMLKCVNCREEYPVTNGVPRLLLKELKDNPDKSKPGFRDRDLILKLKTKTRFSYEWEKFAKDEIRHNWYKDSYAYIDKLPADLFECTGKRLGLDVGCGSGADLIYFAKKGFEMVGIDLADSVDKAFDNSRRFDNIHILQADVYAPPFRKGTFDFIYSFGVLHHLPRPQDGFNIIVGFAKPKAPVVIYVYEDFSDRIVLVRYALKVVSYVRKFTSQLNPGILHIFCIFGSPFILLFFSLPAWILRHFKFTEPIASRIPYRHTIRLDCIVSDLYDRFAAPIENRYSKDQIRSWYENLDMNHITIDKHRGWVAWGLK